MGRSWSMVSRFGSRSMVSRFRSRGVVGWSMDNRSMMNNRGLIRGRFVVYRWWRGMVGFWGFIRCRCMVGFGSMVGDVGRCVNAYNRFLYTTIAMDRLGRGSRLAGYMSMVSIVGLVDRHMD